MAEISITPTTNPLMQIIESESLNPGSDASYELCKLIYAYHPIGKKMVDFPVEMAMYKPRTITIPASGPFEKRLRDQFNTVWRGYKMDDVIKSWKGQARMYGAAGCIWGLKDSAPDALIDKFEIANGQLYFNVLDPLVMAGSLVTDQNPNSPDFLKVSAISASGINYPRARSAVIQNERPLFIQYTTSSYGYVGRSVYQRALYPLRTFIQSMFTDNFVTIKAGVIVLNAEQPGSIVDNVLDFFNMRKRMTFKDAVTGNVINIGKDDAASTLNLTNVNDAMTTARTNVIENIATAADMPSIILNSETFAQGFADGSEDAKVVARYIDGIRNELGDCYQFLDPLIMHMAWTKEFYETLQAECKEWQGLAYQTWFARMRDSFAYTFPQLLEEPESELAKQDKVRNEAIIEALAAMVPHLDPENKAEMFRWAQENFNQFKRIMPESLNLDFDALMAYEPPTPPTGFGAENTDNG